MGSVASNRVADRSRLGGVAAFVVVIVLFYVGWAPVVQLLAEARVWWAFFALSFAVALVCCVNARRQNCAPVVAFVGFWCVWLVSLPLWSDVSVDKRVFTGTARSVLACALLAAALALLGRGTLRGARAFRTGWLIVVASTAAMGVAEVLTQQHYSPYGPWLPPPWSPAGPFTNPNNFAVVLLLGVGLALCRMTERMPTWRRVALGGLVLVCVGLIVTTLSRAALAAVPLMALVAVHLEWRRPGGTGSLWSVLRRNTSRGMVTAAVAIGGVGALLLLLPGSPLRRFLFPADDATEAADNLRLMLVRAGLDVWSTSPITGIGGGLSPAVVAKAHPEIGRVIPLHNGFIQILVEYGLVVGLPLVVVLTVVAVRAATWRRPSRTVSGRIHGRPRSLDSSGAAHLVAVYLVCFMLAGVLTSSPVLWMPWWAMLAGAVTCTWALPRERSYDSASREAASTEDAVRFQSSAAVAAAAAVSRTPASSGESTSAHGHSPLTGSDRR